MAVILAQVPAFVLGLFVGFNFGVLVVSLMVAAKRADSLRPGGD